jgi:cellulose synthase/poly-beta-1,6-N-acetylglucosamine synthase-like glycosyltransferase
MRWSAFFFFSATILLSVPVAVVCAECLAWLLPKRRNRASKVTQPLPEREPLVVLILAHDQESCLAETLRSVKSQLRKDDQILLVADNCADRTVEIAREEGAEVIERLAPPQRGMGRALGFGLDHLKKMKRMPRVTIVIDADCTVEAGAIEALAARVIAIGRPVQAIYLSDPPIGGSTWQNLFSEMALLVRNAIRPGGANRLGLPCLFTGSGMAFPWHVLSAAKLSHGNPEEDTRLGIGLAIAGCPAALCEEALVVSRLPGGERAARTQQTHWEWAHFMTLLTQVPRLISVGFRKRKLAPLTLALDLCVPPIAVLALLIFATILASAGAAIFTGGSWFPAQVLVCGAALLFLSLTIGCARFGRASLPAAALLTLLMDIWETLSIYFFIISHFISHLSSLLIAHLRAYRIRTSRSATAVESAAEITADGAMLANEAETMPMVQATVPAEPGPERLAG